MDQAEARALSGPAIAPLSGVWAAIFTPFLGSGRLDLKGAEANASAYAERLGLDGVFCNGIMGEGGSLTVGERRSVLEAILEGAGRRLRVGVVATHHAPRETIALARHAGAAGADHIVLMRPRGPWGDEELGDLADAVVDAAGRPLVLFESTAPGMAFGPGAIARIAQRCVVIGVKATGGVKQVADLRRRFPELVICDPHEDQFLPTLLTLGDRPLYADPEPYLFRNEDVDLVRAYRAAALGGDADAALAAWRRLGALRSVYDRWIIGPLDQGRSPVPALKHWAERRGLAAGPPRFPLRPLTQADRAALDAALDAADRAAFE